MITGAHAIIYSTNPDADRSILRDVFKLTHVDVGGGWLIFGLPPAEVAVHPSDRNNVHELYLMCEDIEALVAEMTRHALACDPVQNQAWGLVTRLTLPGGGKLGIYQPRHARPAPMTAGSSRQRKKTSGRVTARAGAATGGRRSGVRQSGARKTRMTGIRARKKRR
jgi:hypothetical protein